MRLGRRTISRQLSQLKQMLLEQTLFSLSISQEFKTILILNDFPHFISSLMMKLRSIFLALLLIFHNKSHRESQAKNI
ncbi:hypothetical protein BpHYR1_045866 [Brachionus plicatilis]|uniref:Uncharacterized protein n=1 Tax=Brachionus plicatilis TaxID=10195 RepID=A0A3M7QTU3_BRAPC|nr:hypothetical protein BpHYR1_045866 [Brachionus plicatilis]